MSFPAGPHGPRFESAADREVREAMLRQGYTPAEVDQALADEAAASGRPAPAGAYGGGPAGAYGGAPAGAYGGAPTGAYPGAPAGAPSGAYPTASAPAGVLPWALGLLAYIPVPLVSMVIAGIAMAAVYPSQRRRSPVAAENARRAANWGLTVILVVVLMLVAVAVLSLVLTGPGAGPVVPLLAVIPLGIAHLVVVVLGIMRANRGQVSAVPIAIPFLRG